MNSANSKVTCRTQPADNEACGDIEPEVRLTVNMLSPRKHTQHLRLRQSATMGYCFGVFKEIVFLGSAVY